MALAPSRGRTLQGLVVNDAASTNSSDAQLAFDDASDADCTLGRNCTGGGMVPAARGLCVTAGTALRTINECWDVCQPKHKPTDYVIGEDTAVNSGMSGLVAQVRAGMNSFVQCPKSLKQGDSCPPGNMCSQEMLSTYKIANDQGMCVIDERQPNSRACWDMCDSEREPVEYITGAPKGSEKRIWELRASGDCPSDSWWPWIFGIVLSLCVLGCCGYIVLVALRLGRKRQQGLSRNAGRLDRQAVCEQEETEDEDEDGADDSQASEDHNYDEQAACEYGSHDMGRPAEPPLLLDERDLPPPPPLDDRYGGPPRSNANLLPGMPPLALQPEHSSFSQQQPLLQPTMQTQPVGPAHSQPAVPFHYPAGTHASAGPQPLSSSFNPAINPLPSSFDRLYQPPLGTVPAMNSFGTSNSMLMQPAPPYMRQPTR